MTDNKFSIYFELGSSQIRAAAINKIEKEKNFFLEKNCITNLKSKNVNLIDTQEVIQSIIFELEKKTNEYLDKIHLMIDSSQSLTVSLSLQKNIGGKNISKDQIEYLIQDGKQQILEHYVNYEILHIIVSNYIIDQNNFENPQLNLKCNNFAIEVIFICLPKNLINEIKNVFKKCQISPNQISCSSYVKSLSYKEQFESFNNLAFIDVGYEKTSVIVYNKNQLLSFETLPVGSNHITKDLSKVLKINEVAGENIKNNLNEFVSLSKENNDLNAFKLKYLGEFKNKEKTLDLINKIIHARVDEILNLSFKSIKQKNNLYEIDKFKIILLGQGSKILDNKNIDIKETIPIFDEIVFFEENLSIIFDSALRLDQGINKNEVVIIPKKVKKAGFFEKLFHFFK